MNAMPLITAMPHTTPLYTVLAIDDEPNNLRALRLDLEDEGYQVLTAIDGVDGWRVLQENAAHIHVILLDRMMPNRNGIEFMQLLKTDPKVASIPVIMQTAAAEKEQVVEGIQAGVYYYMTKPYEKEILLSIVNAALEDRQKYLQLREELQLFKSKLRLVRDSYFEVHDMHDAHYFSTFISQFFPDPQRVLFGINELLINAIEHGNLGITYDEKSLLNKSGKLIEEIERRQNLAENADKNVLIRYTRQPHQILLFIKDCGPGFDWQNYMEISPERATHSHGRGIALSRMMSFDQMEYMGCGNEVMCQIKIG
jgi:hypothetical protein